MSRRSRAGTVVIAAVAALVLVGCGDSTSPSAADTVAGPSPTQSQTSTPSVTSTPSLSPSPSTASTPARPATTTKPPANDDENGEVSGQLIIEYPGKPLKRTTSTSSNPDVVDLQVRLGELGATVPVNGVFGASTEAAVKSLQRSSGLTPNGIVDRSTWVVLFSFGD